MKKFFNLVAITTVFASIIFSGCNNPLSDNNVYYTISESNKDSYTPKKTITVNVSSEENIIVFPTAENGESRTVLPEPVATAGDDAIVFYLGTKKKGENSFSFKTQWNASNKTGVVNFTAAASDNTGFVGTVSAELDLASYDFKLYAVPKSSASNLDADNPEDAAIKGKAIFVGYAAADIRYNDTINFYLSSNGLTANGNIDLAIKTTWALPSEYRIDAQNSEVKPITIELRGFDKDDSIKPASALSPKADNTIDTTQSYSDIKSGSYNVVVRLLNTTTKKTYIYSEKVIVLPNRVTKGEIIIPELIDYAPTQPADLIVGYADPTGIDVDYYEIELAWTDTSYNERGFELELLEVSGDVASTAYILSPTNDTEWQTLVSASNSAGIQPITLDKTTLSTYINAINDGLNITPIDNPDSGSSLNMNNNHVNLYVPLGKRYVARIRAYNNDYRTAWTYANMHPTATDENGKNVYYTAGCTKGESLTINGVPDKVKTKVTTSKYALKRCTKVFDDDVTTINRFRLSYYLGEGSFIDTASDNPLDSTKMPATVTYESQHNKNNSGTITADASENAIMILNPVNKAADAANQVTLSQTEKNTYYDTTGNKQTDVYLQLAEKKKNVLGNDYYNYWKTWNINSSINGTIYGATEETPNPSKPPLYLGYKNLSLFAVYTETPQTSLKEPSVVIQRINNYELKRAYLHTQFLETETSKTFDVATESGYSGSNTSNSDPFTLEDLPNTITISNAVGVTKLTISIENNDLVYDSENNKSFEYNDVSISLVKCLDNKNVILTNKPCTKVTGTNAGWSADLDIQSLLPGAYIVTVTAKTNAAPLFAFTQNLAIIKTDY